MGNLLFVIAFYVVTVPGTPFATLLSKFKQMGDGNGNESGMISYYIWSTIFGIAIWVFLIAGGIWAWNNVSISFLVKN